MFMLIKKVSIALLRFSRSLASVVNVSDHTKCYNQPRMASPTFIDLTPDE